MEGSRFVLVLALTLLTTAITPTHSTYHSATLPNVRHRQKVTRLHFYLFDIISGTKPSAVEVARPKGTKYDKSATPFGSVWAIDDALREGPEFTSKVVGNAQGLYVSSVQDENSLGLVMYADFGFTTGKFNGSSFSVFSRNPIMEPGERELAVVGGRGRFRMAKGFVKVKTQFLNATNGDAILEYKVTLVHS
ncbi:dirigent protein 15 [Prunus yedoensis var. nudiflora]|uniref:Dirigent protein n=1 Tax=Prunus yedoensis var. nudiflora TaxID=2094558 RepID=A0A314ZMM6_PRUYE|nr:dirigent protein 15 [Prunus yedoensis var. nudiflora]